MESNILVVFTGIVGIIIGFFLGMIKSSGTQRKLESLASSLKAENNFLKKRILELSDENESLQIDNKNLLKENSTIAERERNLQEVKTTFQKEFENISRKIIEENRAKFSAESTTNLKFLLDPMKENFNEFKRKIEENHQKDTLDRNSLKFQIENIITTNNQLNIQAENLTKALKGDNKVQGNWGEMQLEILLESAGLIKGIDYITQASGLSLKDENNKLQQPDVIINLPDNKHIIIDAKVSLVAYEQFCNSEIESEKAIYLKNFITAIKSQINDLSSKAYHANEKIYSPDYTIMFMPLESAYVLAISADKNLHQEAWDKKIILVSSNTLFAILKTVSHVISLEKRNKNSDEIARQSGAMLDKFVKFTETLDKVGLSIDRAKNSFDESIKLLSTGKGSLVSRAEKLQELGAKTKDNKKLLLSGKEDLEISEEN